MREVNPGVKVNLWLVNPRLNLSMEQSALRRRIEILSTDNLLSRKFATFCVFYARDAAVTNAADVAEQTLKMI